MYYDIFREIGSYGVSDERKNATKPCDRNCEQNKYFGGLSTSHGCTKCPIANKCKFFGGVRRTNTPVVRYKKKQEKNSSWSSKIFEDNIHQISDKVSQQLKILSPDAYQNMTRFRNSKCRLGYNSEKCFSALTTVLDYTAHYHKGKNYRNTCNYILGPSKKIFKQLLQPWRHNYIILVLNQSMKIFFGQIHSFSLFH